MRSRFRLKRWPRSSLHSRTPATSRRSRALVSMLLARSSLSSRLMTEACTARRYGATYSFALTHQQTDKQPGQGRSDHRQDQASSPRHSLPRARPTGCCCQHCRAARRLPDKRRILEKMSPFRQLHVLSSNLLDVEI